MTTLNSQLQLALINRKKDRNLVEKGFTLVELMIVIVIVGILSAVALPSFLGQRGKAESTEAIQQIGVYLKDARVQALEGVDAADIATNLESTAPEDDATNYNYSFAASGNTVCVTATASTKSVLKDEDAKILGGEIDTTGTQPEIFSTLVDADPTSCA